MYHPNTHLHFVGIGGVGMAGIAEVLLNLGYRVSGSDMRRNALVEHLDSLGAKVYVGHASENLATDTQVLVTSSAIAQDNPEVLQAHELSIPVIPRAQMLAELMRMKYGVAVAGSHGKTTTTSILGDVLSHGGLDPTVIVGGRVLTKRTGARLGAGQFLVAEADESDGSFCMLQPAISVVTNIDTEHLNHYGSFGALEDAFLGFMSKVPFYGAVVACFDDPVVRKLCSELKRRVISYGLSPEHDISATELAFDGAQSSFNLNVKGEDKGRLEIDLPGVHMVSNALAAIGVGIELGLDIADIKEALASFPGISRRNEVVYMDQGVLVLDDYAHHPTEIKATLAGIKTSWQSHLQQRYNLSEKGRLVALFQPHRYTRTRDLFSEFVAAFSDADEVVVGDIYPAGEAPIEGISARALAEAMPHLQASYVGDLCSAVDGLARTLKAGDVVITLGAGDVGSASRRLAEELAKK